MFTITMLPAHVGDALWIEYGPAGADPNRILIDAGTNPTWNNSLKARVDALAQTRQACTSTGRFELLIVTHVDSDHVGGIVPLLSQKPDGVGFDEVWFNAWRHLDPDSRDIMGPIEGEMVSVELDKLKIPWNRTFRTHDHAVRIPQPGPKLRARKLPGGMRITVVAPTRAELDILKPYWRDIVIAEGLETGKPSKKLTDKALKKGAKLDLLGSDPIPIWADYDPKDLEQDGGERQLNRCRCRVRRPRR